ncbi:MAG TPA: nucleoside triphosphate pyrophosphohydrolase family protein [Burkholderiales bacterium]|nr:nucleoside triphosphate pyrophosphohydrolase family protein [Burkholderiales bacterium]
MDLIKLSIIFNDGNVVNNVSFSEDEAKEWVEEYLLPFLDRSQETVVTGALNIGEYPIRIVFKDIVFLAVKMKQRVPVDSFDVYQNLASLTAVYNKETSLEYLTTALASEAGEFAGKVAKYFRGDKPTLDREACLSELGDVLWTLSELAGHFSVNLSYIAETNIKKLEQRQINNTIKGDGDSR